MRASKYKNRHGTNEKESNVESRCTHVFKPGNRRKPKLLSTLMAHISLNAGIKQWGKKAREPINSEMSQLLLQNTFEPRHQSDLTNKEK